MINKIKNIIAWYVYLRKHDYSWQISMLGCVYNSKYWHAHGEWPYGMKKLYENK